MADIKDQLDKSLSVNPAGDETEDSAPRRGDAGSDESIAERLERDPASKQARLDRALDESMDASDPPATTQPVHNHEPAPSSGYDAEAEQRRQDGGTDG